jgi:hypothetical protein
VAVTVRGLTRHLRRGETLLILVSCSPPAGPAAFEALGRAVPQIRDLGPSFVSEPIRTPLGPLIMADLGTTGGPQLRTIPGLVVAQLEQAGIEDAVVQAPPVMGERYSRLASLQPAVGAWWTGPPAEPFGTAPRRPPEYLLELGEQWLRREAPPGIEPVQLVISAEIPVTWATLRAGAGPVLGSGSGVSLVVSDFATAAAGLVIEVNGGVTPNLGLTWAATGASAGAGPVAAPEPGSTPGSGPTPEQVMLRRRDDIRAAIARGVPVAWAAVSPLPDARRLVTGATYSSDDPASPTTQIPFIADTVVPEALWYQVLTVGQLDRLGGLPPGAVPLADGCAELTVGTPEQWQPGHPDRPTVQARARQALRRLLVDRDEAHRMSRQRMQAARERDESGFFRR